MYTYTQHKSYMKSEEHYKIIVLILTLSWQAILHAAWTKMLIYLHGRPPNRVIQETLNLGRCGDWLNMSLMFDTVIKWYGDWREGRMCKTVSFVPVFREMLGNKVCGCYSVHFSCPLTYDIHTCSTKFVLHQQTYDETYAKHGMWISNLLDLVTIIGSVCLLFP